MFAMMWWWLKNKFMSTKHQRMQHILSLNQLPYIFLYRGSTSPRRQNGWYVLLDRRRCGESVNRDMFCPLQTHWSVVWTKISPRKPMGKKLAKIETAFHIKDDYGIIIRAARCNPSPFTIAEMEASNFVDFCSSTIDSISYTTRETQIS